jgi:hypothetical protein
VQFDTGGTASDEVELSIPVQSSELYGGGIAMYDGSNTIGGCYFDDNNKKIRVFNYNGANWELRTNYIRTSLFTVF